MHKFRPGDKNSRGTAGAFYERFFPPANLKMRTKTKKKKFISATRPGQRLWIHGHELTQTENG